MNGFVVNSPGIQTSVQDRGRFGYQWSGMCPAGAMDLHALRLANILVGNARDEAGLEMMVLGPDLTFYSDEVIAITGADLSPKVDGREIPMYTALCVQAGQRLHFGGRKTGCRAYIAFAGGLDTPVLYGSRSTLLRIGIGGVEGRALQKGDVIPFRAPKAELDHMAARSIEQEPIQSDPITLRVIMGPQDYLFSSRGIENFLSEEGYTVSTMANRQGYRLEGAPVEMKKLGSIVSDGIANGAVQIPPNQKPIVLLAERQSTGGYAKIANVITVDLPKIGQAMPGSRIRFQAVTVEEAEQLMMQEEADLKRIEQAIQNARDPRYRVVVEGRSFDVVIHRKGGERGRNE